MLRLCTEKTVDVRRCPDDVTLRANSPQRRRAVHWPEPEFVGRDGAALESSCTKNSGTEFAVGSTKVDCFPAGMTAAGCSFVVNVVGMGVDVAVKFTPNCWGSLQTIHHALRRYHVNG